MPSDLRILTLSGVGDLAPGPKEIDLQPLYRADRDELSKLYFDSYPAQIGAASLRAAREEIDATLAGD